ncbi:YiiX/YebB-like N1pC/P60 family cysteine hydrolase [Sporolactobacillus terrae]|uniref:Distant relative of cell wall-associated hydrolase-like protein n=2 Tax=Sporolactobacillus terrae TaxID=269673 RepID=A0ABX5Q5C0_9BACL|nr:YiiX/YebB-like N1pC/P60 family cysteine hydrolase [Sporolactobacillus terrae]QAA21829.1 distant relative of cell wall-associated hydrolase-like protein [Sporolactobacillus terrae]QAA24802.1 distant relative of cell wall-associated hydrolase-like protein [Sporolactobacillus terrae]UAK16627.1 distant relative of cell wall-associated hydrolase-like protein [Sporolactobacillus terrae]
MTLKKLVPFIAVFVVALIFGGTHAFAEDNKSNPINLLTDKQKVEFKEDIKKIENSADNKKTLNDEQKKELAQDLINIEKVKNKGVDKEQVSKTLPVIKKADPEKYNNISAELSAKSASVKGRMGTNGDVLVTYDNKFIVWRHGHAAIVLHDNNKIVEAWPDEGVRVAKNNWGDRFSSHKKFYILHAGAQRYTAAQSYAYSKRRKPYSLLVSKGDKSAYYCSQLVWQSWRPQRFNLDSNGGFFVTPADLENDSQTVQY